MKLLARLMSHGFAVALVVLLAIGFVYRGELFPEWELPDFLVLDSTKGTTGDESTGKVEPAPIQDDWMSPATATASQQDSEIEDETAPGIAVEADPITSVESDVVAASETQAPMTDVVEEEVPAPISNEDEPVEQVVAATDGQMDAGSQEIAVSTVVAAIDDSPVEQISDAADEVIATDTEVVTESAVTEPETVSADPMGDVATSEASSDIAPVELAEPAGSDPEAVTAPVIADSEIPVSAADETTATVAADNAVTESETVSADPEGDVAGSGAPSDSVPVEAVESSGPESEVVTVPGVVEHESPIPAAVSAAPMVAGLEEDAASGVSALDSAPQVDPDVTISAYQLLASAREAYWLHDYPAAEDFYRRMIMDDPYNPDGYGELANMYFSQGNWEAAASAYYEAGLRLVKSGLLAPASELVDVIRGLNGAQADALEQEIQKTRESSQ